MTSATCSCARGPLSRFAKSTCILLVITLCSLGGGARVEAKTFPTEVAKLLALKAELETRGLGYLLDTWKCPPEGQGQCDPCGYG